MLYVIILVICIVVAIFFVVVYGKRVLSPAETYIDPNAPMTRCSHCHTVITKKNAAQHGVNCPQRTTEK
jgi:hypothetical protein